MEDDAIELSAECASCGGCGIGVGEPGVSTLLTFEPGTMVSFGTDRHTVVPLADLVAGSVGECGRFEVVSNENGLCLDLMSHDYPRFDVG